LAEEAEIEDPLLRHFLPPPLTEPAGNAGRVVPTVRMMRTARRSTAGTTSVAFPSEPAKGKPRRAGWLVLMPLDQNPRTACAL